MARLVVRAGQRSAHATTHHRVVGSAPRFLEWFRDVSRVLYGFHAGTALVDRDFSNAAVFMGSLRRGRSDRVAGAWLHFYFLGFCANSHQHRLLRGLLARHRFERAAAFFGLALVGWFVRHLVGNDDLAGGFADCRSPCRVDAPIKNIEHSFRVLDVSF